MNTSSLLLTSGHLKAETGGSVGPTATGGVVAGPATGGSVGSTKTGGRVGLPTGRLVGMIGKIPMGGSVGSTAIAVGISDLDGEYGD